jgi:hypothetical protein
MHTSIGGGLNFFGYYYPPAWSIIYWLAKSPVPEMPIEKTIIRHAKTGHAMAMLLHALDDHLNDEDLMATHLVVLIRSQAWVIMNRAFAALASDVGGGSEIARDFVDTYYASVTGGREVDNLRAYCDRFKNQMAMGFVAPVLMSKKMNGSEEFVVDIEQAYASFGIAWRLMDDFKDLKDDLTRGTHSSYYFYLPDTLKMRWDETHSKNKGADSEIAIFSYIAQNCIQDCILSNIRKRLYAAASLFEKHHMKGLAKECVCLSKPLETV